MLKTKQDLTSQAGLWVVTDSFLLQEDRKFYHPEAKLDFLSGDHGLTWNGNVYDTSMFIAHRRVSSGTLETLFFL